MFRVSVDIFVVCRSISFSPCIRGHFCPWTRTMSSPSRVLKQWNRRSCLWVSSLWGLMGVCEKDAKSWECLRINPEVAKLRSWRQEVEETFSAVHLIREFVHSSYWEFDSPIVSHRVLENYSEFVQCSRSYQGAGEAICLLLTQVSWKGLIFYKC